MSLESADSRLKSLIARLGELEIWARPGVVGLFRATRHEPTVSEIETSLGQHGWKFCYPRIADRHAATMEFAQASVLKSDDWVKGEFGIQSPREGIPAVDPKNLTAICVPGVRFGMKGERKGRGSGFYDRYLTRATQAIRIGICWDDAVSQRIDQNAWDQKMDVLVTETRVLQCSRGKSS